MEAYITKSCGTSRYRWRICCALRMAFVLSFSFALFLYFIFHLFNVIAVTRQQAAASIVVHLFLCFSMDRISIMRHILPEQATG
jgi:hypothetical protein